MSTVKRNYPDLIDSGKAKAGLIIPSDYAKKIARKTSPQTQLIIDGTDPTTARTALNSGILISQVYSMNLRDLSLKKMGVSLINISRSHY